MPHEPSFEHPNIVSARKVPQHAHCIGLQQQQPGLELYPSQFVHEGGACFCDLNLGGRQRTQGQVDSSGSWADDVGLNGCDLDQSFTHSNNLQQALVMTWNPSMLALASCLRFSVPTRILTAAARWTHSQLQSCPEGSPPKSQTRGHQLRVYGAMWDYKVF